MADLGSRALLREALGVVSMFCEAVRDERAVPLAVKEIAGMGADGSADREAALAALGALIVINWAQSAGQQPRLVLDSIRVQIDGQVS